MSSTGNAIRVVDVTNRDGVQTSRLGLAKLQKTILNMLLNQTGVYQAEFGFPFTHHEINYLNANVELAKMKVIHPMLLSGWIRAIPQDVRTARKLTNVEHLNMSISTSDQMIKSKFGGKVDRHAIVKSVVSSVKLARKLGFKTIGVNAEDASRTELSYLVEFGLAAKDAGADRLRYCDTLGFDDPFTIYDRIAHVASTIKMPIEMHCHNDLGMAVAVTVAGAKAAIDSGVDAYINTTINGMGERAGNADMVGCILALKYSSGFLGQEKYQFDPVINTKMFWKLAKYASYAFGVPIPINQVGVGANAFAHESGIHADGALKDRRNYELYDFEELGRGEPEIIETGRAITAGEYSGIKGFRNVYNKLEVEFKDEAEATRILELVRYANVHTQKPLVREELLFIAEYPDIAEKIFTMVPPKVRGKKIISSSKK